MENKNYKQLLYEILTRSLATNNTATALNTIKEIQTIEKNELIDNGIDVIPMPRLLIYEEPCYKCELAKWVADYADKQGISFIHITTDIDEKQS
jgi:hypothetical protein